MTLSAAAVRAALLRTIAMGESEPEGTAPGSGYNKLCGWHPGDNEYLFSDFSKFPDWPGWTDPKGGEVSHAAGRAQFEPKTWAWVAGAAKLADFTPASQDAGAWWLAGEEYTRHTGRELAGDLLAGALADVVPALRATWPSLSEDSFPARWQQALAEYAAAHPEPPPAPVKPPAPAPQPAPAPPPSPAPPSPIHGGIGTGGAAGLSFALVDLAATLFGSYGHPLPGNAQADLVAILTVALGFLAHWAMARAGRPGKTGGAP